MEMGRCFLSGFPIPVILIGLIQLVVGGTVYFRTDKQIQAVEAVYQKSKKEFASTEIPRMNTVMKKFNL